MNPNDPRFPTHDGGHVESWFLRANDPAARRALWLKATVLRRPGEAVAEVWCARFDGAFTRALKHTVPLDAARFGAEIEIGGCVFRPGPDGYAAGRIDDLRWELSWQADPVLGAPLCPYPSPRMVDGGFPRSKLLTPVPVARFDGHLSGGGDTLNVESWLGMQGHNWGREHAYRYVWGQCIFPGADGAPLAMAEGFSGQLKLGPVVTPVLSVLIVRRGQEEYRFNRIYDLWNQQVEIGDFRWRARFVGPAGEAVLQMEANPAEAVCLGYHNPDGSLAYCRNSKLAKTTLQVNPFNAEGFTCHAPHGGALELLDRTPDPRFPHPV